MNEQKRLILAIVISGLMMLAYAQFFAPSREQAPAPAPAPSQATGQAPAAPAAPAVPPPAPAPAPAAAPAPALAPDTPARLVTVESDLAVYSFSERGGSLRKIVLKNFHEKPGQGGGQLAILDLQSRDPFSLGTALPNLDPQLANRVFAADRESLAVRDGQPNQLTFTQQANGITVRKTYIFRPGAYDFELALTVENQSAQPVEFSPETTLADHHGKSEQNQYAFTGMMALKDGKLEELDRDKMEKKTVVSGDLKWLTLNIPYFMGVVIPLDGGANQKRSGRTSLADQVMTATLVDPLVYLAAGQSTTLRYQVFYGPRDLRILDPLGHDLDKSIDFGWFDIIAKPMLALLNWLYGLFGNYGIAIIIVTILTKVIFFPLAQKSYKSMKHMQKLQPQIAKLREKYKNDRQRMNQEVMQLYRTYKVNPMGGCLPMLVQIPVFIAFYQVLGASIELRHAPFWLWINDLSAPDRLFPDLGLPYVGGIPVLTLLMGASMFIQQKMTPTGGDPTQAKIMLLMPVIFTFMFINFSSGLVLYWLVNNILSIGQQVWTNRSKA